MAILQNTAFATVKNLTKPNIKSQLLTKTHVLQCKLLRNIKVQKANNGTITVRISVTALQANNSKALGGNTGLPLIGGNSISEIFSLINNGFIPSYAQVEPMLNTGLSLIKSDVRKHHIIASHYQPLNNHSFNYVDAVAVRGNNVKQELRNLFKSVQHHTIVDVFFCLSFIFLPFMGELRLAIALLALWWGGSGNKPFIRRIPLAVDLAVSNLPAALHLGQIIKTSQPLEKV